ncbi:BrnT family toxin [Solidesulfovibrio sp.]|uniref:BrnT family toxin n=1 Tax=Solidesulfovibrio sp. TaxID=2910990 RepID=UPI002B1F793E|nr:BrnT family toxin [Solidesulfovibrio sp.]MEA5088053.1 BrnT family toxin [Solidesulfovibrio sp.]
MEFEWDEVKRQANIAKHGIDFYDAKVALEDAPMMLVDTRKEYGERRCIAAGEVHGHMLLVVFTIRNGVFRIISARKANSRERRKYADQV